MLLFEVMSRGKSHGNGGVAGWGGILGAHELWMCLLQPVSP